MFQHDREINSETCETGKQSQLISNVLCFEQSYYEWLKTKNNFAFGVFKNSQTTKNECCKNHNPTNIGLFFGGGG